MTNEECKKRAQELLNDMSIDEKADQIGGISTSAACMYIREHKIRKGKRPY